MLLVNDGDELVVGVKNWALDCYINIVATMGDIGSSETIIGPTNSLGVTGTEVLYVVRLPAGRLLSALAFVTYGGTVMGTTFVRLALRRRGAYYRNLASGYASYLRPIWWDESGFVSEAPSDTPGWHQIKSANNPAAGANLTITVPSGVLYHLRTITLTLTTDANVADRAVYSNISHGGLKYRTPRGPAHAASTARTYVFAVDYPLPVDAAFDAGGTLRYNLPSLYLASGATIEVIVATIQAGDQISAVFYDVDQWFTHAP